MDLLLLKIMFIIRMYKLCSNIFLEYFGHIDNIDYSKYEGKWYQIYKSEYDNLNKYIYNEKCITHEYKVIKNDYFKNYCIEEITVKKTYLDYYNDYVEDNGVLCNDGDKKGNGKLLLYINNKFKPNNYWIVKLGEEVDNKYQYSFISNPYKLSLIVLARDIKIYNEKYDKEVKEYLDYYNFNYKMVNHTNCEI